MNPANQTSENEKTIISESAIYSFTLYARMFIKVIGSIIIAKILSPSIYGLRNAFDMAIEYESYSDLGSFSAANRQIPYYRGQDDIKQAKTVESSVFKVNLFYAFIMGILLIGTSIYLKTTDELENVYTDFILFLGLMNITGKFKNFYATKLKYENKFKILGAAEILYGFSTAILCVTLALFYGFRGLLIGLLLADLIFIVYVLKEVRKVPSLSVSYLMFWQMVKIGFPIMIVGLQMTLLRSADRIVILGMLNKEALGYFSIATIATGVIIIAPSAIRQVTLPPLMEKLGRTNNDISSVINYLIAPTVLIAFFVPYLLSAIYFSIHLPIEYFLTKYTQSIYIVKVLTFGSFFVSVSMMPLSLCFAFNKQTNIVILTVPSVIINFIINFIMIKIGLGIIGVAYGTCFSYFVYCNCLLIYTLVLFKTGKNATIKFLTNIYLPFLYAALLIISIDLYFPVHSSRMWYDTGLTVIKFIIFAIIYSMLFFYVRRSPAFIKLLGNVKLLRIFARWV